MDVVMKNRNIRTNILMLICEILIGVVVLGIISIAASSNIKSKYDFMLEFPNNRNFNISSMLENINKLEKDVNMMIVYSQWYDDDKKSDEYYDKTLEDIESFNDKLVVYEESITTDPGVGDEEEAEFVGYRNELQTLSDNFKSTLDNLIKHEQSNDIEKMKDEYTEFMETADAMQALVQTLHDGASAQAAGILADTQNFATMMIIINIVISIVVSLVGIILGVSVSSSISKPLVNLAKTSKRVAQGEFDVSIRSNFTNEVGQLSNNFSLLVDSFRDIVGDMNDAFDAINKGKINKRIDLAKYKGAYNSIANSINKTLDDNVNELLALKNTAEAYANGDFSYICPRFPGEKAVIHESFDMMKNNLESIANTTGNVIDAINDGNLSYAVDPSVYKGDWYKIINELNELVTNIAAPIKVTKSALGELSKGNLSIKIDYAQYKGEFREMLQYIQTMVEFISGYINEISNSLQHMANQNLDISIDKAYIGDFAVIKQALELIVKNFNNLIGEIMSSSEQIAASSQMVADSATSLAQGAAMQASAVEELTATIGIISENTNKSMENVNSSNNIAAEAKQSAESVKQEIGNLLKAMTEINDSSNDISNIIKAIEDIAFQTNILALNAAVEAARAGEHGKGFAVVADEVRNLATRSSTSANETADLIAISIEKAEQGSDIVNNIVSTINKMTEQIEKISELSKEVVSDSETQNTSIKEINIGINQIANVVSDNTTTSEKSAAASQELASQAAVFKETVSNFVLKENQF